MSGWGALAARGIKSAQRKHATSKAVSVFSQVIEASSLRFRIDLTAQRVEECAESDTGPFTHYVTSWPLLKQHWPAPGLDPATRTALSRGLVKDSKSVCEELDGHNLVLFEQTKHGSIAPWVVTPQGAQPLDLRIPLVATLVQLCGSRMYPTGPTPIGAGAAPTTPAAQASSAAAPHLMMSSPSPASTPIASKFCTACGTQLGPDARFCNRCGTAAS